MGQSLPTSYTPPPNANVSSPAPATSATPTIFVTVSDDRPFVRSGEKPPYYLGKYRGGFGNPWSVKTENDEPLAEILARDLKAELTDLGYAIAASKPAGRNLGVSIVDFNFDGYHNGRLWYDLRVAVSDSAGKVLASDTVKDATYIKGSFWLGAKGGFEREMPRLYPEIIRKIVRGNDRISVALTGSAK